MQEVLVNAEDLVIDIPKIWLYLGQLIGAMIDDRLKNLQFLRELCESLHRQDASAKCELVRHVLHAAALKLVRLYRVTFLCVFVIIKFDAGTKSWNTDNVTYCGNLSFLSLSLMYLKFNSRIAPFLCVFVLLWDLIGVRKVKPRCIEPVYPKEGEPLVLTSSNVSCCGDFFSNRWSLDVLTTQLALCTPRINIPTSSRYAALQWAIHPLYFLLLRPSGI